MTRAAPRATPNPAEGIEVPYSALGFHLPPSRRSFAGDDPGPDAPDDRRPAFAVVPGRPRLVAERAALRVAVGYDTAVCARLDAAKRLLRRRQSPT